MAWQFTPNILIQGASDKLGQIIIVLKNALVASGKWRVRGSGDGKAAIQLQTQTAGVGGSYDVLTGSPAWSQAWNDGRTNTFSQPRAWVCLEEIASGRVLQMQRCYNYQERLNVAFGTAAAVSGATANTPPTLTAQTFLNGTSWNSTAGSETAEDVNDLLTASTYQYWMQLAIEDVVKPGNVSPWWFAVWNRGNNTPVMGGFWESFSDTETGVTQPLVVSLCRWAYSWGLPGNGSTGGLWSGTRWRGGNGFLPTTESYLQNTGFGASPPTYQQLQSDDRHRTQRPWVLQPSVSSKHIARLEHFYMNKVAREYPTTYNIAGAEPLLVLGHHLVPWTAVVPESSP